MEKELDKIKTLIAVIYIAVLVNIGVMAWLIGAVKKACTF